MRQSLIKNSETEILLLSLKVKIELTKSGFAHEGFLGLREFFRFGEQTLLQRFLGFVQTVGVPVGAGRPQFHVLRWRGGLGSAANPTGPSITA